MILIKLIGKTQVIEEITLGFKNTKKKLQAFVLCCIVGFIGWRFPPFFCSNC